MNIISLAFLSTFLAGCASVKYADQHYDPETGHAHQYSSRERALTFEEAKSKWTQEREGYVLTFKPTPEFPKPQEIVTFDITVLKKQGNESVPISSAMVTCKTFMPTTPGHVHFSSVHPEHSEISPGVYRMPIMFGMGQDWEVHFKIDLADGKSLTVEFPFKVNGPPSPRPTRYEGKQDPNIIYPQERRIKRAPPW